jgi:hypothetical protein
LTRPEPLRIFPSEVSATKSLGLFDGLSGIGFVLLRLAHTDYIGSVAGLE